MSTSETTSGRPRGDCPVCEKSCVLRNDGTIPAHGARVTSAPRSFRDHDGRSMFCTGSYHPPLSVEQGT